MAAGHFGLQSLVAIVDRNQLCIDGRTEEIMAIEPIEDRFRSLGWDAQRIDGNDLDALLATVDGLPAPRPGRPQALIAETVKGRGLKRMDMGLNMPVGPLAGDD